MLESKQLIASNSTGHSIGIMVFSICGGRSPLLVVCSEKILLV